MKESDKRKGHTSSKLHMIYISSNKVRHPVTETVITLYMITRFNWLRITFNS